MEMKIMLIRFEGGHPHLVKDWPLGRRRGEWKLDSDLSNKRLTTDILETIKENRRPYANT